MTKWQAVKDLEGIMDNWMDFTYWAYLQLEMRGEWSQERMREVLENHKKAGKRLREYRNNTEKGVREMESTGVTEEEIIAYRTARHKEHYRLLTAWRSLDGLPE